MNGHSLTHVLASDTAVLPEAPATTSARRLTHTPPPPLRPPRDAGSAQPQRNPERRCLPFGAGTESSYGGAAETGSGRRELGRGVRFMPATALSLDTLFHIVLETPPLIPEGGPEPRVCRSPVQAAA